ncbi:MULTISPECIES: glycosyltransferase [Fusobacterium]|uniref:glycosyltransferase n=1 Tax=Fusobacterium TaxID=848 RepID=UPI001476C6F1|nr:MULTISPECIES: glycosyltransferase [Fusobacterium]NME35810.1 glycosyltransferase [Fusobacterium sp. FSA-380-WT-3A]
MKIFFMGSSQIHRLGNIMKNKTFIEIENSQKNKILKIKEDIKKILKSDIIYGAYIGVLNKKNLLYLIIGKCLRKKVICHWIGSDVLVALKNPKKALFMQRFIDMNLSGSEILKKELESIGIKSIEEHIILNDINYKTLKMPEEHSVLVYLPTNKEDFYGEEYIKKLSKEFLKIKFYVVANENKDKFKEYPNIINLGKVSIEEMEKIYKKISILIRMVEHDGLSLMLMEALAKGKEVIYSYDFPYTYKSNDYKSLKENFVNIIKNKPTENIKGAKYITENFKVENYINNLISYFKEVKGEKN